MALAQFQIFRDVAQTRSFSKAAKLNEVSQSAVSQQVQELERQLGASLVDRSCRPLRLTAAGELYQSMCRDILNRRAQFDAELANLTARTEGSVRVAAIYSVGFGELSRIEADFRARFPGSEIEVEYLRPEKVYQAIRDDRADLGLVSYAEEMEDIAAIPWREEEMVVALPPKHPLARNRTVLPFELNGADFVAFDDDLPIRRAIDGYFATQMVEVEVVHHFDNIAQIKEAVTHGAGLTIVPRPVVEQEAAQGRLAAVPLGPPGLTRPLGIIHPRRKPLSRAAAEFLRYLREGEDLLALPAS